jgi:hypothetical protein
LPFEDTDDSGKQCARRVNEILAATTHIGTIRARATEICVALQDLELPAFVTLTIIDEAVHENSIRMWVGVDHGRETFPHSPLRHLKFEFFCLRCARGDCVLTVVALCCSG